jgi:hypothetical protein
MRVTKVLAGLCTAGFLASVPAVAAAAAGGPVHIVSQNSSSYTDTATCPFPIAVQITSTSDDKVFYDGQGNVAQVLETDRNVAITFTANGTTLDGQGSGGFDVTFNPDGSQTVRTFGINLLVTIPHQGSVILDAGHAVFLFDPHIHVLFQAGPSDYDLPAFCSALAGT